jgi:hypothetical protein
MSASFGISDFVTQVTQTAGVSEAELSSILLMISVVAIGGAGVGLIVVCLRALLKPGTQPWIELPLEAVDNTSETVPLSERLPLSGGRSPSVHDNPTAPGIAVVEIERPQPRVETTARVAYAPPVPAPPASAPPASAPTVVAPRAAVPVEATAANTNDIPAGESTPGSEDEEPETRRSGNLPAVAEEVPESAPATTLAGAAIAFGEDSPIPLISRKPVEDMVEGTLETGAVTEPTPAPEAAHLKPSEPPKTPSHSGLVATVPEHRVHELASFQYGARRA